MTYLMINNHRLSEKIDDSMDKIKNHDIPVINAHSNLFCFFDVLPSNISIKSFNIKSYHYNN